jgi:hypothetical protein
VVVVAVPSVVVVVVVAVVAVDDGAMVNVNGVWKPLGSTAGAPSISTSTVGAPITTVIWPVAATVWVTPGCTVSANAVVPAAVETSIQQAAVVAPTSSV